MSLRGLFLLYKAHLRARPLPELLALLGIAAGVALLFAVQVANRSVTGSFDQLTKGIAGKASLEVAARGPQGFGEKVFKRVEKLPQVKLAAPVVERRIAVKGPKGRRALTLIGVDERLKRLGGTLIRRISGKRDIANLGFYLTEPTAKAIGVTPGDTVTVEVGERTERIPLAGIAPADEIGSLAQSPVAVAHLALAQKIAAMPGALTRILVAPAAGQASETEAALRRVAEGKLNVRASSAEAKLLGEAAASERQTSALFSVISLLVGVLLAYNAMLLTMAERQRVVASLHMLGVSRRKIVAALTMDALILGAAGSLLGLLIGDQLSRHVMHDVPGYLSTSFAIGKQRIVEPETIGLSIAGGTLAALAAVARPAVDLLRMGPVATPTGRESSAAKARPSPAQTALAWGGAASIAVFTTLSLLFPETTLIGVAVLVLGLALILPSLVRYLLTLTSRLSRRTDSAPLRVALGELVATPVRATALASVGALAMFAILGVTGPAQDLLRGNKQLHASVYDFDDLWISPGGDENTYRTQPFDHERIAARLRRLEAVKSVHVGRLSFLDLADRRLLIVGKSSEAREPVASSQIIKGDVDLAAQRIRRGGWAALADTVARERDLKLGEEFTLPTPSGMRRLKLAATITNYGWTGGAIVMSARDYARMWKTEQASVLEVGLAQGVTVAQGRTAVDRALGGSSLQVRTATEGRRATDAATRQALVRVNQIADMVVAAAVLAIVAAMLGAVWQRRQRIWGIVSLGMGSRQLFWTVFFETGAILAIGCAIGGTLGFILQALGGRWLQITTAHPVAFEPAFGLAFKTFVLATVLAVLAVAIPVRIAFSGKRMVALPQE